MGTITKKTRTNGSTAYRAEVRIMRRGVQVFKEVKTFDSDKAAKAWIRKTESALDAPGALEKATTKTIKEKGGVTDQDTLADLIGRYIADFDSRSPLRRTRRKTLEAIAKHWLGKIGVTNLTTDLLKVYAQDRAESGAGPATIRADLSHLSAVLVFAKPAYGLDIDADVVRTARPMLSKLGLIAPGKTRNRRPEEIEINRLLAHFRLRFQHSSSFIPMAEIVEFAMFSAMRQGEITRITWDDLDEKNKTIWVRDRKDPKKKDGNHQLVPLLGPAFEIVMRQPKVEARIFPYEEKSVSTAFTRTCQLLGITDLHFHDLRREAASRLMEMGFTPQEVASVTGHKSLDILWRVYTKINPGVLHQKFNSLQGVTDDEGEN